MDWFLIMNGITALASAIYTIASEMGNANIANALNNDAAKLQKLKEKINSGSSTANALLNDFNNILVSIENRYGASVLGQKFNVLRDHIAKARNTLTSAYNDYTTAADRAPSVQYSYGLHGWAYDPQKNAKKIEEYTKEVEEKFNKSMNEVLNQELPNGIKIISKTDNNNLKEIKNNVQQIQKKIQR